MRSKVLAMVASVVGMMLLIPASALAQIPGVPPGTIPPGTVPPEVEQAIEDAIGQVPNPLIPAIEGVGGAAASPGSAQASVVEIPGAVTVGKSESNKDGSKVTVLNVGGTDVLVKDGDGDGGTWGGEAAALGQGVDALNDALCPGGPPATGGAPKACVVALYSQANERTVTTPGALTNTNNETNSASFRALSIYSPAGPESLTIGSTSASTTHTTITSKSTGNVLLSRCTDIATSFLISGSGQLAALLLVNPGGPLNGVRLSVFQAC